MHWARLIKLLYSAERCYELATDEDITGRDLRASDPCFSCATHSLPGDMPMIVEIKGSDGILLKKIKGIKSLKIVAIQVWNVLKY